MYSINTHIVTAGEDEYELSFEGQAPGYIEGSHIKYYVDGVLQGDAARTFLTATRVKISPVPVDGSVIEFKRITSPSVALVNWLAGAPVSEALLDKVNTQYLYLTQEVADAADAADLIGSLLDVKILEDAAAVSAGIAGDYAGDAHQSATEAQTSNVQAGVAYINANNAKTAALIAQTAAELAELHAGNSADAASADALNSYNSSLSSSGYRDEAGVFAGNASDAKDAASGSAGIAGGYAGDSNVSALAAESDAADTHADYLGTVGYAASALGYKDDAEAAAIAAAASAASIIEVAEAYAGEATDNFTISNASYLYTLGFTKAVYTDGNVSNGVFTAPVKGVYACSFLIRFRHITGTTPDMRGSITKNGSEFNEVIFHVPTDAATLDLFSITGSFNIPLDIGETAKVTIYQKTVSGAFVDVANSRFGVSLVKNLT